MAWEKCKYDKQQINNAGDILSSETGTQEEKDNAIKILDNWRACHAYPMHIFQMRLSYVASNIDKDALTAQRLKRVPSILFKLRRRYYGREPSMKLSQMQDIGGCRAILSSADLAKKVFNNNYLKSDLKHKLMNKKDYISEPKPDGYRSLHLVYAYKSDKIGKQEFNGLLIEIQIRSKLQHFWATAVETVGFMTRQSIKCSEGDKNWTDFFKLVSSAFAKMEGCPPIPNTPTNEKELYLRIKEKAEELKIVNLLKGWTNAINLIEQKLKKNTKGFLYLLELDISSEKIVVSAYSEKQKDKAIEDYAKAEQKYQGRKEYDVVLVGSDTTANLKKAYPNYFIDTRGFLSILNNIISKY